MTAFEQYFARLLFKLKIYESNGNAFESLFSKVISTSRPDFLQIKPYGNIGDRGNDGYEKAAGRYFQVFAPEDPTKTKHDAVKKAVSDFETKLKPYWNSLCPIQEYFFVFNDKYFGSDAVLEKELLQLQSKHGLKEAKVYLAKHLETELLGLSNTSLFDVVGYIPALEAINGLDYSIVSEVMTFIQQLPLSDPPVGKLVVPNLDEKIKFNGLNQAGHWIKAKQAETWQVDEYFEQNSDFAKNSLRDHLAQLYSDSLAIHSSSADENGDLRFMYILEKMTPPSGEPIVNRLRREVALVIMAKYFESCDIFKEPSIASSR